MPPSICRCGSRRPTVTPRTIPGWSTRVLRQLARDGKTELAALDTTLLDTPEWLMRALDRALRRGDGARHRRGAHAGAGARSDGEKRSGQNGRQRSTAACSPPARCARSHPVRCRSLPGYDDGAWWVQDAAAALPARLLGDVRGKSVADLCAAPGGKTAQLALAGAQVTAVDRSAPRLDRLRQNLERLQLSAEIVEADAARLAGRAVRRRAGGRAVLIDRHDPPASRHPLAQVRDRSRTSSSPCRPACSTTPSTLLKPGGTLVYCTCSLEARGGRGADRGAARPQSRPAP